ncbi:hypothetical protein F5Y05DRAFT_221675 [Hypoxylon sp. FL0543]|nr:hypothetical protein F5Y05DRAFT_221675 [Hypoxylon sp. FL0543]
MAILTPSPRHGRIPRQPGSIPKRWNKDELRKCGAIGTASPRDLDLQGEVHPVFANWVDADAELRKELEQPLLLASRLLEAAGLPWISDFLAHDIFAEDYPGRKPSSRCSFGYSTPGPRDGNEGVPRTIVRHHQAPWASPEVKEEWNIAAEKQLRNEMASALTWELDADMFREQGWVGYTCRHPRCGLPLDQLDNYETIQWWDKGCEDDRWRNMSILMSTEFPKRLAELRRQEMERSEEYLLTAFMATVTILHELGHAVYWKDCRALTQDLREPFYGADLEMELGDSFVASIFGGWVPVPIKQFTQVRDGLDFSSGIAWRQSLSWDFHRLRPKHRAHYSIPVDFISRLFSEARWQEAHVDPLRNLIRPLTLEPALKSAGICTEAAESYHATAAIPDFHCTGQGWRWNRLPGARFRIPQYDGYLCPDLDLPIATEDVIEEPRARPPLQPSPIITEATSPATTTTSAATSPSWSSSSSVSSYNDESLPSSPLIQEIKPEMFPIPPRIDNVTININITEKKQLPYLRHDYNPKEKDKKKAAPNFTRLAKEDPISTSPDRSEISLDELRNRLSRLLGVSFDEMERFFDASRCA